MAVLISIPGQATLQLPDILTIDPLLIDWGIIQPGSSTKREVRISNPSNHDTHFSVGMVGEVIIGSTLAADQSLAPSGQTIRVGLTLQVPDNAHVEGLHPFHVVFTS